MKKILKEKFVVIVYGPTGVGKSGFAEKLASLLPSQLVNCDIGQFYAPFGIGTAKPDWKSSAIKQHLFDVIDAPKNFNVCEYRKLLFDTIEKIWKDDELPILVGGSGFYLKSLFFPPESCHLEEKSTKDDEPEDLSGACIWEHLYKIDPKRAEQIGKNDTYRIQRALDLWTQTGEKPSVFSPKYDFPCNFLFVFLERDRKEMYCKIEKRTYQMMDQGWLQEVRGLMGTPWENFLKNKKLIGYDVLMDYLASRKKQKNIDQTIQVIQKKTRNYAKRQMTFWRSFNKELQNNLDKIDFKSSNVPSKIDTINLTTLDLEVYIKQLLDYLKPLFE